MRIENVINIDKIKKLLDIIFYSKKIGCSDDFAMHCEPIRNCFGSFIGYHVFLAQDSDYSVEYANEVTMIYSTCQIESWCSLEARINSMQLDACECDIDEILEDDYECNCTIPSADECKEKIYGEILNEIQGKILELMHKMR